MRSATLPRVLSILPVARLRLSYQSGECFFNSLFVGVPCSLIFWHFWLFIVFRLVVVFLLLVRENEGLLPLLPSWPELRWWVLAKDVQVVDTTVQFKTEPGPQS